MEWVLQVFDEIDDAIAAWRQWWLRAAPEMELLLVGCWGIAVFGMTHLLGARAGFAGGLCDRAQLGRRDFRAAALYEVQFALSTPSCRSYAPNRASMLRLASGGMRR